MRMIFSFLLLGFLPISPGLLGVRENIKPVKGSVGGSGQDAADRAKTLSWQSQARFHRGLTKVSGTLAIDSKGVNFESAKSQPMHWPFVEIQTSYFAPRQLVLKGYEKRGRLRAGTREFRFDLQTDMPPAVAAELARQVSRPVRNANPGEGTESALSVPAHHNTLSGGSNGVLRFHTGGIDYVSRIGKDSRSWRWGDIQTLSNPDAYHLTVFGYLETYSFDLKEPLKQKTYDDLNDEVYRHHEQLRGTSETGKRGVAE